MPEVAGVSTDPAAAQIKKTQISKALRIYMRGRYSDADESLQQADNNLQANREHHKDEAQPLLCTECCGLKVKDRRDEDGNHDQDDACNKSDRDDLLHWNGSIARTCTRRKWCSNRWFPERAGQT
jgi:hypothetical protein